MRLIDHDEGRLARRSAPPQGRQHGLGCHRLLPRGPRRAAGAAPGLTGDERMAALETVAADLVGHGATRVRRFEPGGMGLGHIVMQDPEGNEFCLD